MAIIAKQSMTFGKAIGANVAASVVYDPPELFIASNGTVYPEPVKVGWKRKDPFTQVLVKVSRNPEFTDIVLETQIADPGGSPLRLPPGTYWFRGSWVTVNFTKSGRN